jgi:hypothetical protein
MFSNKLQDKFYSKLCETLLEECDDDLASEFLYKLEFSKNTSSSFVMKWKLKENFVEKYFCAKADGGTETKKNFVLNWQNSNTFQSKVNNFLNQNFFLMKEMKVINLRQFLYCLLFQLNQIWETITSIFMLCLWHFSLLFYFVCLFMWIKIHTSCIYVLRIWYYIWKVYKKKTQNKVRKLTSSSSHFSFIISSSQFSLILKNLNLSVGSVSLWMIWERFFFTMKIAICELFYCFMSRNCRLFFADH